MTIKEIATQIITLKPNLPTPSILEKITFQWNKKGLSAWHGGHDVNEEYREDLIDILEKEFEKNDPEYANILRFLLQQEIKNCYHSETMLEPLRTCYDSLADLKLYQDIPLLLSAIDDSSFDANLGLTKTRLFDNGYENVMAYLTSNEHIDQETIDRIQYYAEYFGYQ